MNKNTEAILHHLTAKEGEGRRSRPVKVAYRANRCIMFRSRLFHQTDAIHFRNGFRNRRINVTLLFE